MQIIPKRQNPKKLQLLLWVSAWKDRNKLETLDSPTPVRSRGEMPTSRDQCDRIESKRIMSQFRNDQPRGSRNSSGLSLPSQSASQFERRGESWRGRIKRGLFLVPSPGRQGVHCLKYYQNKLICICSFLELPFKINPHRQRGGVVTYLW